MIMTENTIFLKILYLLILEIHQNCAYKNYCLRSKYIAPIEFILIEESEKFTNKLNQDIFKKQLKFANNEINIQYQKLNDATFELLNFQRETQL